MRSSIVFSLAAAVAAAAVAAPAMAAPRTLTIQKRSFLDAGKVVPVGSMSNYVQTQTVLNVPVYYTASPARFGGETLPQRFFAPGWTGPLLMFGGQ